MKIDTSSYPLKRVWKIASRWSEDGNEGSSVLDVFRDHKLVFVGRVPEKFSQIEVGDLLVVSDGREVVAMGAALSKPAPIISLPIQFSDEERMRFNYEDWVLGCQISWADLKEEDFVHYRPGAFHEVHENAEHYRNLYRRYTAEIQNDGGFEIQARSCTLAHNEKESTDVLWRDATRYVIPIFQRAYSWGADEVSRLVNDLLDAFSGRLGGPVCEPMFIGTMQVENRVKCHEEGFEGQHHVIDGQQRITTLILLLRALELAGVSGVSLLPTDYTRRLSTKVGSGVLKDVQQTYLRATLEWDGCSEFLTTDLNRYHCNLLIMREIIAASTELSEPLDRSAFIDYLLSKVYFVVIETRAGLSKTLQIFKAINTTGMDLDGGDVFKIRFYEYLRSIGHDESVFNEIAKLYDEIGERNDKAGRKIAGIETILSISRHYVATEADLTNSSRLFKGTTFFERFFDVVINKERRDGFDQEKCATFELSMQLFKDFIEIRYRWEELAFEPEGDAMENFIGWGRYGSYHEVIFLFCHRFRPDAKEIERFTIAFAKLLHIHSLIFEKITTGRKTFLHELLQCFAIRNVTVTVDSIIRHIEKICASRRSDLLWAMNNHQIAWMTTKNLVCRLLAMLDESESGKPTTDELRSLLFHTEIDIEHIESFNHKNLTEREKIQAEWKGELHSLGNLIVLERDKNRGAEVSNHDYATVKRLAYAKSRFATVRNFAETYPAWNLKMAIERKQALAERITTYLCGPGLSTTPDLQPP